MTKIIFIINFIIMDLIFKRFIVIVSTTTIIIFKNLIMILNFVNSKNLISNFIKFRFNQFNCYFNYFIYFKKVVTNYYYF